MNDRNYLIAEHIWIQYSAKYYKLGIISNGFTLDETANRLGFVAWASLNNLTNMF